MKEVPMLPGGTVSPVAAPLAATSAVSARVLPLSCISPSARRERGTVSSRFELSIRRVVLAGYFFVLLVQHVNRGIDLALLTNPLGSSLSGCPDAPVQCPR